MQNDPEFNIKFVQLVENYPVIYNTSLDEYAHKDTTRKAWEEIATALSEPADACIQKWRVLRGSYTRFLRTRPIGTCSAPGRRAYYLAKYMEFLLPHLKYKNQEENGILDEFTEQETTSEAFETVKREFTSSFDDGQKSTSFSDYDSVPKEEPIASQTTIKQLAPTISETASIDFLRTRKRPKAIYEHSDPDMDFFKSILPDIKDLPQKKKYIFRMSVLKTVSDLIESEDLIKES